MNQGKNQKIARTIALCIIAGSLLAIAIVSVSYRMRPPANRYQVLGNGTFLFDPTTGDVYVWNRATDHSFRHYSQWVLHRSFSPKTNTQDSSETDKSGSTDD